VTIATRLARLERTVPVPLTAHDRAMAADPVAFACSLGVTPDDWQARVLRSPARRHLLLCARQSGKSTTTAIMALHHAVYRPASLVLLVSPSLRQSSELFRKVTGLLRRVVPAPALDEDNRLSLTLANGARVVSLPSSEATIRGFSAATLIIEDEAARVPDDLHVAIRPMLATTGGTLALLSTPFGKRGHFWEAWEHGGDAWAWTRITAYDCPRIAPAFLEDERASMGDLAFRSEYLVEFCDVENQAFSSEHVLAALDDMLRPLWGAA